jgi:hypothetical protein
LREYAVTASSSTSIVRYIPASHAGLISLPSRIN